MSQVVAVELEGNPSLKVIQIPRRKIASAGVRGKKKKKKKKKKEGRKEVEEGESKCQMQKGFEDELNQTDARPSIKLRAEWTAEKLAESLFQTLAGKNQKAGHVSRTSQCKRKGGDTKT